MSANSKMLQQVMLRQPQQMRLMVPSFSLLPVVLNKVGTYLLRQLLAERYQEPMPYKQSNREVRLNY